MKMKGIDINNDGKVLWEEFKVFRYLLFMEKGKIKFVWFFYKFDVFIWWFLFCWLYIVFNWVIKEKSKFMLVLLNYFYIVFNG